MSDVAQGRSEARSASDSAVHLFVVSHRNIGARAIHFIASYIGALAFVPVAWATLWLCSVMAAVFLGTSVSRQVEHWSDAARRRWAVPVLQSITIVNSACYGVGAMLLWRTDDEVARVFSVVILSVCLVYALMQYYASPRVFFGVVAPYLAGLGVIGADIAAARLAAGDLMSLLAIGAAAAALANLLVTARRQLAGSRAALREARTVATERAKAAAAASTAKSTFLATMSHEIRTPLNGVLGMAQAMAAGELSDEQRERLNIISESGSALLTVLNDVLDVSKMEAGKLELEETEFDIAELVAGVCGGFRALAEDKGVGLVCRVAPGAQGAYRGDPVRLRQILTNLVSNALKFTSQGEVRVDVAPTAEGLGLAVSDTGIGIAPEALNRLFDSFVQADASTTRRFGGTGLGLSICRQLADLMGGRIEAVSTPGTGSTFTVTLPLERIGETSSAVAESATETQSDLDEIRVLAAEDNAVNQLVLKTLLAQVGIDPVIVPNGAEALEAWRRQAWDVILMDVQMPEMDGPTATREIRAEEARTGRPRTPIVALTANALTHQIREYAEAGMDAHVAKPIEAGVLFQTLQAMLSAKDEPEPVAESA